MYLLKLSLVPLILGGLAAATARADSSQGPLLDSDKFVIRWNRSVSAEPSEKQMIVKLEVCVFGSPGGDSSREPVEVACDKVPPGYSNKVNLPAGATHQSGSQSNILSGAQVNQTLSRLAASTVNPQYRIKLSVGLYNGSPKPYSVANMAVAFPSKEQKGNSQGIIEKDVTVQNGAVTSYLVVGVQRQ